VKYRVTYEVVREVESEDPFPKEVLKKNLLDLKKNGTVPDWYVTGEKLVSMKIKSVKVIK
jgi:hypothetical protein